MEGEYDAQETGYRITQCKHFGTIRGLGHRLRPAGGGSDRVETEAVRRSKGPSDGRTPGTDRDLGAG